MHQRGTARCEQHISGDVAIAEDLEPPVADPRRSDQKPWAGRFAKRGKIDVSLELLAQRIEIQRVELAASQVGPNATELPAGEKPPISISERNETSFVIRFQNCVSFRRAPSRPPLTSPQATSAALTAPTLAPLIAPISQPGSSRRRSSTPQANAPKEPPPCKASESLRGGQGRGGTRFAFAASAVISALGACTGTASAAGAGRGVRSATGCDSSADSWIRLPLELKNRASAKSSDGRRLGAVFCGLSVFSDTVSGALTATGASAGAGVSLVVDQISAAESSKLAALRSGAAADSAAPASSNPSFAPDESLSLIRGNPDPTRTTPLATMAGASPLRQSLLGVANRICVVLALSRLGGCSVLLTFARSVPRCPPAAA